ncbi:hypothetical protein [Stutzerimonas stutzeri]|uniref:hypothetical protein n=1 Tax=Stutzerimonas stutzeri TaxID=316 RepID=UPI001691C624|nr:hypothetical protein [Stutzerimonas stutzeri]WRQ05010.1 hypothetical protein U3Q39_010280 [Stutzerimonas stutzeri]
MVIHYATLDGNVACGRTGTTLQSSADGSQVSCKLCLRSVEKATAELVRKSPSLAELRAAVRASAPAREAAPAKAPTAAPGGTPARAAAPAETAAAAKAAALAKSAPAEAAKPAAQSAAGLSARAEWQKRLAQLPGKKRLPRGLAGQGFI